MTEWRICPWCPPDDNLWPADAFGAAGSGYEGDQEPCSACFLAKYPRRRTRCSDCNKPMETRGKGPATCRDCRRAKRPEPKYRCAHVCECGKRSKRERCYDCRKRAGELPRRRKRDPSQFVRVATVRKARARPKPMKGGVTFQGFRFERAA